MPRGLILHVALLLTATACSPQGAADVLLTRDTAEDGVLEVVSHAPEPLPAPWVMERDLVIGVEYGEEGYMLRGPTAYAVMEDGTHVILDSSPTELRLYDADGTFIRAMGRPGSGPTDLPRNSYFHSMTAVDAGHFDIWGRYAPLRIQRWSPVGLDSPQLLDRGHPLSTGALLYGWDGRFLVGTVARPRTPDFGSAMDIVRTDLRGASVDTLHLLAWDRVPVSCFMIEAELGAQIVGSPLLTSDDRLCTTAPYEDWVRVFDVASGAETLRFRWKHRPDVIPDTLIAHYRGQMAGGYDMEAGARWLCENLSVVDLAEGPRGEVWVVRSVVPSADGTWTVDVFDREGVYRGRMPLSDRPRYLRPYADGYLYAIGLNGEAPALIRYRLSPAPTTSSTW